MFSVNLEQLFEFLDVPIINNVLQIIHYKKR